MARHVREFVGRCRDVPVAVVGFSMGGWVVMDALCDLLGRDEGGSGGDGKGGNESIYGKTEGGRLRNLAVATVYGDPTFRAGRGWDAGSCEVDAVSPLPTFTPGIAGEAFWWSVRLGSECK